MNFLFVKQQEFSDGSNIVLARERAEHAIKNHGIVGNLEIACVVEGIGQGKFKVELCQKDLLRGTFRSISPLLPRTAVDLVVAYSRPQTVKKLLQLSASFGLLSISFVRTKRVVLSYLTSKVFELPNIESNIIKGLEQSGDGVIPKVQQYNSLELFLASLNASPEENEIRLFGELGNRVSQVNQRMEDRKVTVLLGPEAGLIEAERQEIIKYGFYPVSLGPRMQRIEVAAAALIGRLL